MARIASSTVEQIKARADILDVVSDVVQLRKRGRNYFGLCPFHEEKTPSFSVNPAMGIFHCFGCGKGGNAITFIMEHEKIDYFEALKRLADRYHIEIEWEGGEEVQKGEITQLYEIHEIAMRFYRQQLLGNRGVSAREYLQQRQIPLEILEPFSIGFAPNGWEALLSHIEPKKFTAAVLEKSGLFGRKEGGKFYDRFRNRLMFPIINLAGRPIAFGGRALDPQEEAKYLNSPETPIYLKSNTLYGLYQAREAIQKAGAVILVEGYLDFLRLFASGFNNVVASSGTALTSQHARLLHRFTNQVVICYDGDEAGQKASERAGFVLLKEALDVKVIRLPAEHDPDSFIREQSPEAFAELYQHALDFITFQLELHSAEIQSVATKSRYVEQLAQELAEIRNPVARDLIIAEIAERLRIREEHIQGQIGNYLRRQSLSSRSGQPVNGERRIEFKLKNGVERAEFEILKILLTGHQIPQEKICKHLSPANFHHPQLKALAVKIYRSIQDQAEIDPAALFDAELDTAERSYLSRLVLESEDLKNNSDLRVIHNLTFDCLKVILGQEIENTIRVTREEIRAAEKKGEEVLTLVQKLAELQKQSKTLEERLKIDDANA